MKILNGFGNGIKEQIVPREVFHFAFTPWKLSARECNLQYRKGCLYTGNNRMQFPFIYMPEEIVVLPDDTGALKFVSQGGFWIHTIYTAFAALLQDQELNKVSSQNFVRWQTLSAALLYQF